MTAAGVPDDTPPVGRVDNGLLAPAYVPLTDVSAEIGPQLLAMLGRARIAAYLDAIADDVDRRRLHVAADERGDARAIVASAVRGLTGGEPTAPPPAPRDDPLAGVDTDKAFAELVSDWHVDTVAAVRDAQRQLREQDAEWRARAEQAERSRDADATDGTGLVWLDEDHFVPPEPPPLPRLAAPTVGAMSLLAASILLLGLGGEFGLASDLTLLLGVVGLLVGAWMLVLRLRDRRDDDDDGAVV